jgi:hypothetical protein
METSTSDGSSFLSTGADFVFLPEKPPSDDDWQTAMCDRLTRVFVTKMIGLRMTIVNVHAYTCFTLSLEKSSWKA